MVKVFSFYNVIASEKEESEPFILNKRVSRKSADMAPKSCLIEDNKLTANLVL